MRREKMFFKPILLLPGDQKFQKWEPTSTSWEKKKLPGRMTIPETFSELAGHSIPILIFQTTLIKETIPSGLVIPDKTGLFAIPTSKGFRLNLPEIINFPIKSRWGPWSIIRPVKRVAPTRTEEIQTCFMPLLARRLPIT